MHNATTIAICNNSIIENQRSITESVSCNQLKNNQTNFPENELKEDLHEIHLIDIIFPGKTAVIN